MVAFPAIMLTWFFVLLYWLHPTLPPELTPLSNWLWDYLLHNPHFDLPNTDLLVMRERRHMLDVKHALFDMRHVWWFSLGLWLSLLAAQYRPTTQWRLALRMTTYVGVTIVSIAGIMATVDFHASFNLLHYLFFTGRSWVFPAGSLIIQLFPLNYFEQFFMIWSGLAISTWVGLWWISRSDT